MSSRSTGTTRTGLGAIDSERFDAMAAVGGWRGILESVVPTLMFVLVMAVRPAALVAALLASLAISAICLMARLVQRQSPAQVVGGVVLVLVSALWAWRSGDASNFYATGLMINAAWLVACLVSLLIGWPLVGALMTLWHRVTDESAHAEGGQASRTRVAPRLHRPTTTPLHCPRPGAPSRPCAMFGAATTRAPGS